MKNTIIVLGLAAVFLQSCHSKKTGGLEGAYAFETTYVQNHEITGQPLGTVTERDTIFLQQADNGYQLSTHRWHKNDYDQDDWRQKGDNPYIVKFDEKLSSLVEPNNFAPPVKVAADQTELVIGDKVYKKIKQ